MGAIMKGSSEAMVVIQQDCGEERDCKCGVFLLWWVEALNVNEPQVEGLWSVYFVQVLYVRGREVDESRL